MRPPVHYSVFAIVAVGIKSWHTYLAALVITIEFSRQRTASTSPGHYHFFHFFPLIPLARTCFLKKVCVIISVDGFYPLLKYAERIDHVTGLCYRTLRLTVFRSSASNPFFDSIRDIQWHPYRY